MPLDVLQRKAVRNGERIRHSDDEKEGIDRQRSWRFDLNQNRGSEQQRDDCRSSADEPQELASHDWLFESFIQSAC